MKNFLPYSAKWICNLVLLLKFAFPAFAQHKYIPFPDSNAIWVMRHIDEFGQEDIGWQYFIQKDTIINSIRYHKIVGTEDSTLYAPGGPKESFYGIRNDTAFKQVFIYDKFGGKESLLYDFSLLEGDTFPKNSYGGEGRYGNSIITNIDTITIATNEHLVFYPVHPVNGTLLPYIEGIGGTSGNLFPPDLFEGGFELVCLMLGKDRLPYYTAPGLECKLYHYTGMEEISAKPTEAMVYPQPVTTKSVIELQAEGKLIEQLAVYRSDGSKVLEKEGLHAHRLRIGEVVVEPGIYYYRLRTDKGSVATGKFIKR